jgi:hypothetical protein
MCVVICRTKQCLLLAIGWSFSTNVFHRHLSRLTAIFIFVHAISYTVLDTIYGRCFEIQQKRQRTNHADPEPYHEEGLQVLWLKFGIIVSPELSQARLPELNC